MTKPNRSIYLLAVKLNKTSKYANVIDGSKTKKDYQEIQVKR